MSISRSRFAALLLLSVLIEYGVILFIVFGLQKVKADSFFPGGSIEENRLWYSVGIGYSLLDQSGSEQRIYSENENLVGANLSEISQLSFHSLSSLSDGVYTRVAGVADSVKVVPETALHVWWYPYNETGHVVAAKSSWLFLGQYAGDTIADVVDVTGSMYRNIVYFLGPSLLTKGGESISLGSRGNIQPVPTGGAAPLGKELFVAKVTNPIEITEFSHDCPSVESGSHYATVSMKITNKGRLTESVAVESGSPISLSPGETRQFSYGQLLASSQKTKIHVHNRVSRCLTQRTPAVEEDPNTHALLVSRDDFGQFYWGGITTETVSAKLGGNYCIERIPYIIERTHESCVIPPRYRIEIPEDKWTVEPGVLKHYFVTVSNDGGTPVEPLGIYVDVPTEWAEYITFPDSNYNKVEIPQGYRFQFSPIVIGENESQQIKVNITFPSMMPENSQKAGNILFSAGLVSKTQSIKVTYTSTTTIDSVRWVCLSEKNYVEVAITQSGNMIKNMMSLPVLVTEPEASETTVNVSWNNGSGTFPVLSGISTILNLPGVYNNGGYFVYFTVGAPVNTQFIGSVAVDERTATTTSRCPIVEEANPTISPKQTAFPTTPAPTTVMSLTTIPMRDLTPQVMSKTEQVTLGSSIVAPSIHAASAKERRSTTQFFP